MPGPGNYDPIFTSMARSPAKYSLKGRYEDPKKHEGPPPGTYDYGFVDRSKAPAFGFGTSPQRGPLSHKSIAPGPGTYKVPIKFSAKQSYISSSLDPKYQVV
jgi:hypothetical protein